MSQYLNWLQAQIQNRQPTQIEMMNRNLNEIAVVRSTPKGFGSGLPNQALIAAAAKITAENRDKKKEPKKLEEIARPETVKNPERYARRIGQIAAIAANRTVSQKAGAVEAKNALISKGVGTHNNTFAAFSGSRSGGVHDTELYGDSPEAAAARQNLGIKTVLQPRNDAATREEAEAERKRLKDRRKGTPVLMGGKKVAIKRGGEIQLEEGEARASRLIGAARKARHRLNDLENRAELLAIGSVPPGPDGKRDPSKLIVAGEKVMGGPIGTEIRGLEKKTGGVRAAARRAGDKWLRRVASGTGLTIHSTEGTTEPSLTRFPEKQGRVMRSVDYLRNNKNKIELSRAEPANVGPINTAPYLRGSGGGYHATRIAADIVARGGGIDSVTGALPNVPRQGIRRIMKNIHKRNKQQD